jgi:subtilase family serine protease
VSPLLSAAGVHTLPGHVPNATKYLAPLGRVDPGKRLNLAIGLPLHNPQALTNLLSEIYDPRSSEYQKYLTPTQFAESFSPSEGEYSAAIAFLQSQGFAITQLHGNRLVLDVSASVGDIEKAFHIKLQRYQHPKEPRVFFAPDTEPSVEASVPILDISGLSDFGPPRPLVHKLPLPQAQLTAQPAAGSGPGGTYRGTDFRAAYAPNVAASGLGQSLGLLEFDGYYANDISSYVDTVGLPSVTLTNVLLDGFDGTPGNANMEVALDIEVSIAMAPGLNQIIVYQAGPVGSPNDILSRMASDNLARQISSSWTWSGGPNATTDNLLAQLAAQGQSYFQASGDDGAYTSAIPQPADSPYATVVGGTTLSTSGPGGSWASEKAWNWYSTGNGTNGTSGGISTTVAIPSWQQPVSMASNQGSTTMRNIPDVALTGDNVWITYNNGSSGAVGGTSCSAPLWAAFTALINQQAIANGRQPVGFLNPSLYSIATGTNYSSTFHDITTGNNTNKTSPSKFFAVSGFDLCTGWGTPAGSALINALAGPPMPRIVSNSVAIVTETCPNNAVDPGETVTVNFGLINVGSANTANLVATLQSGTGVNSPSGPQTYGPLATGGSEVARPFSFTATGACAGVVTATFKLQDGATDLGTVSFAIRLGAVTATTAFSENLDGVTAPALPPQWTSTVTSGVQSKWISTNGFSDTSPNCVFAHDTGTASQTELVSPAFSVASSAAQLKFRHNYNLASRIVAHPPSTNYYDGGVLQISIGGGAFSDILAAGGSFVTGAYTCTLSTGTGNP